MPAAYAHHRFGEACLRLMPEKLKEICNRYRQLYDFGVHGPDVLFYYKPLGSNEVNRYGSQLHTFSGQQFFAGCKAVYDQDMTGTERAALLAYILGYLAHFTLDSHCHGFINRMAEETPYSHNYIESQYEAFLMTEDGKDPLMADRSKPLKPSKSAAKIMAKLYPFTEDIVLQAMAGQRKTLKLFYSPLQIKKKVLRAVLKRLKMKGDFGDLFLDREILEACSVLNDQILAMQDKALEDYPVMLRSLMNYLKGKEELIDCFKYDFEGEKKASV